MDRPVRIVVYPLELGIGVGGDVVHVYGFREGRPEKVVLCRAVDRHD